MASLRVFAVGLWGKSLPVRVWLDSAWKSPWMGVLLLVCSWATATYWLFCTPSPGKSVGALAVVATVMTLRGELSGIEKTFLTLVLFVFVLIEIRAIDKDRADNEQKQREFFQAQNEGFNGIATQAASNFKQTTGGLTAAIGGLNSNLQIANQTLLQTQPHAQLTSLGFSIYNAPVPPATFEAGVDYQFNFPYVNNGNKEAGLLRTQSDVYVGKPYDMGTEMGIKKQFERSWLKEKVNKPLTILAPSQQYWSQHRIFNEDEIKKIKFHGDTVYAVSRIEYRDPTGVWNSDRCDYFQITKEGLWIQVLRSCSVLMNGRYAAKQP
jgi:hypothetical protein